MRQMGTIRADITLPCRLLLLLILFMIAVFISTKSRELRVRAAVPPSRLLSLLWDGGQVHHPRAPVASYGAC